MLKSSYSQQNYLLSTSAQNLIYEHFKQLVITHSAAETLEEFRGLIFEEKSPLDPSVYSTLKPLLFSQKGEKQFHEMINYCCQIMIDQWCQESSTYPAIFTLVSLFNQDFALEGVGLNAKIISLPSSGYSRLWLDNYKKTQSYLQLQRLARAIYPQQAVLAQKPQILGDLLYRYSFLYRHCLLTQDSSYEYSLGISNLKTRRRQEFELALVKYLFYHTRLRQNKLTQGAVFLLKKPANPTWLKEVELHRALQIFSRKAQSINRQQIFSSSYQNFKNKFYKYLTKNLVDFEFDNQHFFEVLYKKIQDICPEENSRKLNEFLLLNTCINLLNFLLVEEISSDKSYFLSHLVTHLGGTRTVHLLVKILIFCPKVKPHLDTKLALIFKRYELFPLSSVTWFIRILENFLIAYSSYLGKLDLSFFEVEFLRGNTNL